MRRIAKILHREVKLKRIEDKQRVDLKLARDQIVKTMEAHEVVRFTIWINSLPLRWIPFRIPMFGRWVQVNRSSDHWHPLRLYIKDTYGRFNDQVDEEHSLYAVVLQRLLD